MSEPAIDTRSPLRELLSMAAPVVATMTSYTIMQFVDKVMVSRIGPDPIYVGAQGNGGLATFVPISVVMGFMSVVSTYVSQNLGAGKPERSPAYAWAGLWIALAGAVLLLPYAFVLDEIFSWLGHDERSARLSADYGKILIYGAFFSMGARGITQFFFGLHRPKVVLVSGVTGNLVNFGVNYLLIFGNWGFPALGLQGAAIGTVAGTAVEMGIPVAVFLSARYNIQYATRGAWRPDWAKMRDIWRIGWPGAAMFGNEMLCWSIFMVYLVGGFGPAHATAGWIAHQYMMISFMPAIGISVAMTAIVGRYMGMGRPDLAAHRSWLGLKLAMGYMALCAIGFVVLREPLVGFFLQRDTNPEDARILVTMGSRFMIVVATFQLCDAVAMTLSGALRGAGDTVWVGVVTLVLSWALIVGGGVLIVRLFPGLESLGPWLAAAAYIACLSLAVLGRFMSGQWKAMRLVGEAGHA